MDVHKIKNKVLKDLRQEIPDLIEEIDNFSLNRLSSKKNIVYELIFDKKPDKLPKEVILKLFRTNYAEKEYKALIKLEKQGLPIPKVLYFKKPYLILKKLEGVNLCDFINDNLVNTTTIDELDLEIRDKIIVSVKKLAEWIANLHSQNIITKKNSLEIIVFNKGDTRLRDFIYNITKNVIYGIDFEESYEGNFLDDLAWICCSLLDTNPGIFEITEPKHKIELINYFLKEYFRINKKFLFSFNYFAEKLIDYLNIVIERRAIELSPVRKNVILRNISKKYN
ncbi:MAG: RIO1 family regulatory kinase/ATPase [Candidatus Hodarchaeota archaeon]